MFSLRSTVVIALAALSLAAPIPRGDGHEGQDYPFGRQGNGLGQNANSNNNFNNVINNNMRCVQAHTPIPITTSIATWRQNMQYAGCSQSSQPIADQCSSLRATWIVKSQANPGDRSLQQIASDIQAIPGGCPNGTPAPLSQTICEQMSRQYTLLNWYMQTAQTSISSSSLESTMNAIQSRAQSTRCTLTTVTT